MRVKRSLFMQSSMENNTQKLNIATACEFSAYDKNGLFYMVKISTNH